MLKAAGGQATGFVKVVKVEQGPLRRDPRGHRDRRAGVRHQAAPGTRRHRGGPTELTGRDLPLLPRATRPRRHATTPTGRLEALFVLSITLGLRPGELRKLTWDHVDLDRGVVHVWRSASKSGDTKTPKSKRSLVLPKRAIAALTGTQDSARPRTPRSGRSLARQQPRLLPRERRARTRRDALNWRFSQDDQEGRHRPLARPRGPAHRRLDHEQQRRPDPGDQRHRGPQVHPRHRDRLPARDRARRSAAERRSWTTSSATTDDADEGN